MRRIALVVLPILISRRANVWLWRGRELGRRRDVIGHGVGQRFDRRIFQAAVFEVRVMAEESGADKWIGGEVPWCNKRTAEYAQTNCGSSRILVRREKKSPSGG